MKTLFLVLTAVCLIYSCSGSTESGKVFSNEGHPQNWASHLTIGSDSFHGTAIMKVSSDNNGAILFVRHCSPCHGNDASGKIGPNIQGDTASGITIAVSTFPIMRGHSILTQKEIGDIADYLATLRTSQQPVMGVIDPSVCKQCHGEDLDGGIAQVSCFACHKGPDGSLGHPVGWLSEKNAPLNFHGRYGAAFASGCTTCHGVDLKGLIGPSCFSCHDGTNAPLLDIRPIRQREGRIGHMFLRGEEGSPPLVGYGTEPPWSIGIGIHIYRRRCRSTYRKTRLPKVKGA